MKQEDEKEGDGHLLGENFGFEERNKRMKRGGASNPLGENAAFEDMKQDDEKGWSR